MSLGHFDYTGHPTRGCRPIPHGTSMLRPSRRPASGGVQVMRLGDVYRGTSLIRNSAPLGPYSSPMPRDLWRS